MPMTSTAASTGFSAGSVTAIKVAKHTNSLLDRHVLVPNQLSKAFGFHNEHDELDDTFRTSEP